MVADHFLHSCDRNVWFMGNNVRRNKMLSTVRGSRFTTPIHLRTSTNSDDTNPSFCCQTIQVLSIFLSFLLISCYAELNYTWSLTSSSHIWTWVKLDGKYMSACLLFDNPWGDFQLTILLTCPYCKAISLKTRNSAIVITCSISENLLCKLKTKPPVSVIICCEKVCEHGKIVTTYIRWKKLQ